MNTITQLQEQIDALQEQLLLLNKEMGAKVASKKSSHSDDYTAFKEPYAEDSVTALDIILHFFDEL